MEFNYRCRCPHWRCDCIGSIGCAVVAFVLTENRTTGHMEEMELKIAGYYKRLFATPEAYSHCGYIKDGVSFRFGNEGGWVMSFDSLEELYIRAKKFREKDH